MSFKEKLADFNPLRKKQEPEINGSTSKNGHINEPLPRMKRFMMERPAGRPVTIMYRGTIGPEIEKD